MVGMLVDEGHFTVVTSDKLLIHLYSVYVDIDLEIFQKKGLKMDL